MDMREATRRQLCEPVRLPEIRQQEVPEGVTICNRVGEVERGRSLGLA
jgi:hypothetical protein